MALDPPPDSLAERRMRIFLRQYEEEHGRGAQAELAKRLGRHQTFLGRLASGERGPGIVDVENVVRAFGVKAEFFFDPRLGDEPRYRDHLETRFEREYPHDAAISAFAAERSAEGRPIPDAVIERLRRDVHAWDGHLTRDHLVMLLPIARDRVEQLERGAPAPEPPPVPEGRRRVPPGRPRR